MKLVSVQITTTLSYIGGWMRRGLRILSVITYIIYKGGDGYTSNRLEGCLYTLKDDQRYLPKTKENIRRDI
jgi:hypothetical protein